MQRIAGVAVVVLVALGCSRDKAASGTAADAAVVDGSGATPGAETTEVAEAGGAALVGARKVAVVARALGDRVRLVHVGSRVVLATDLFLYDADHARGTLTRIGEARAYASLLPDPDDDLVGYNVETVQPARPVLGANNALALLTRGGAARSWDGAAWVKLEKAPPAPPPSDDWAEHLGIGFDGPPPLTLPANVGVRSWRRLGDGAVLAVAESDDRTHHTALLSRDGTVRKATIPVRGDPTRTDCRAVPSPREAYVACHSYEDDGRTVFRFGEKDLERVPLEGEAKRATAMAVAADGALWLGADAPARVLRRLPDGTLERFDLSRPPAELARPSFSTEAIATARSETDESVRWWHAASVREAAPPSAPSNVREVLPVEGGGAWVIATEDYATVVLVRIGPGEPPPPVAIGSLADQRNEVRNTRPARAWTGHCPQIFVTLAAEPASGALSDRAWKHKDRVSGIVAKALGPLPEYEQRAALVEGRLEGRRVAGVMLWRQSPETKEDKLEAAATAIVEAFTDNPMAVPRATCTLPVLERAELL